MISAIQVHPHDIRDEGAETVVGNIRALSGISIISPEVSALDERHPYPDGELPHNPIRRSLTSSATLEVPLDFSDILPFTPRLSEEAKRGEDYIEMLSAAGGDCRIVPWVKGLNAAFEGDIDPFCIRTLEGEALPTWLCPSKPEALAYVTALTSSVAERYGAESILLDRMRYPDWSGDGVVPERMFSCFCPDCRQAMTEEGINLGVLENSLLGLLAANRAGDTSFRPDEGGLREIFAWLAFRRERITILTRTLRNELHGRQGAKLWLNLWPPSFAALLGQDYSALGGLCDGAKHFPYHKLGGGADLKGLVESINPDERIRERIFSGLLRFLGLPRDLNMGEFAQRGFPVDFVRDETAAGKRAFGETPIFSGIQIWNIPTEEIGPACEAALAGGADGFFFYCYGWAGLDALREVGRVLSDLEDAGRINA